MKITVPSSLVAIRSEKPLTPAMTSAVWEIAGALDEARVPSEVSNAVWLEIPTARLRGPEARQDNVWLRECLERLTGVKLSGEYRGEPWGAVVLAEWHIVQGGSMARLLIPPAGIYALRSPANFTKIEVHAAHKLTGHARRLYAILSDKRHLSRPSWTWRVEELRQLLGVDEKRAYDRFNNFRARVLEPAVAAINDYGTVKVTMTPEKLGRAVDRLRFDWAWKDPREAAELAAESDRQPDPPPQVAPPPKARPDVPRKAPAKAKPKAPEARKPAKAAPASPAEPAPAPLIPDEPQRDPALDWWGRLTDAERQAWGDRAGRTFEVAGRVVTRREADLARAAHALVVAGVPLVEPAPAPAAPVPPAASPALEPTPVAEAARTPGLLHRIFGR